MEGRERFRHNWLRRTLTRLVCLWNYTPKGSRLQSDFYWRDFEDLPKAFEGFRIVQITDLHGRCFGKRQEVLVRKVKKQRPDLILITGDMMDELYEGGERNAVRWMYKEMAGIAPCFAILGNHPDTVKLLMKEHTDNESSQSKGEDTVWEFVASYGDEKALQSLMESGYRPREQELDDLICDGKSSVVRKALEGKMTRGRIRKEVLLQSAVETGDFPMVQYLVKKGTDMNGYVKDDASDSKRTAMHAAYAGESTEILDYLEENGGDPSKMDSDGADGEAVAREEGAVWNLKNQMIIDERLADGIRVVVLALSFITGIQALLTIIQLRRGRNPAGRIVQEFNRNEYVDGNQILICVPN